MSFDSHRALDTSRNVVVEACAGSGKTWLLSSRIARAIVEGTPPGAILALTFTNKAAAEMRNRVLGYLRDLAVANPTELRSTLERWGLQGPALENAMRNAPGAFKALITSPQPPTISTFHSWYARLAAMAPLSMAGAATLSLSTQPWDLTRKAWQEFFAHSVDQVPYAVLSRQIGSAKVRDAMQEWARARVEWQAFGGHLKGFGRNKVQVEQELAAVQDQNVAAIQAFYESYRTQAARLAKAYEGLEKRDEFLWCLQNWSLENHERFLKAFLTEIKPAERIGPSRVRRFRLKGGDDRFIRKADRAHWGAQAEQIEDSVRALAQALIALLDENDARSCESRTKALWLCGRAFAQCLDRVMDRQHEIDFTGLEALAWDLMGGEQAAAFHARLDSRVQHVLIDEFQDTNPTQWAMLRAWLSQYLQADSQSQEPAPKVFLVGDPKQSIYRFRRADPQVFQVASQWLAENFNAVVLQANATRRCGPQIVEFLNACMPKVAVPGRYQDHESLAPGNRGFVRRLPIANDWQQEGAQIAQALLELKRTQVDLKWSDVRILVRARTHMADYESALLAAGIPFVSDRPGGLLKSPEIRDVIALLRCLAFPWSDADRAQVAQSAIAQSIPEDWFIWASELPVHDLLDRIIHQHDLFDRMVARYGATRGVQCLANLEAFTALALELDTGRLPSLPRFLQEIHRLAQVKDSDAPGLGIVSAAQAVSLSTLHSAKGLEAKVVVLAGLLDRDTADKGLRWLIHWNKERDRILGVSSWQAGDPYSDTVIHALDDDERQARDEDFNLLYVGATRAKQFLIFSATQVSKTVDDKWFTQISPYCEEWALLAQTDETSTESTPFITATPALSWPGLTFEKRDPAQTPVASADSIAIRQGKALHRLLEHGPRLGSNAIARLIAPFALPASSREAVINALEKLRASDFVNQIFNPGALAYAEAEWPIEQNENASVLRPDRLVRISEHPETWWIIDFKWRVLDSELWDYANQLAAYRRAFQTIRPAAVIEAKIVTASAEVWDLARSGSLQRVH
jgi:ATP-dependent helicase/nuclease subunit A